MTSKKKATSRALASSDLLIRNNLLTFYQDILTEKVLAALLSLAHFNNDQKALMDKRYKRREERARLSERITFLSADAIIPGTDIKVQDARSGNFVGSEIPADLQRQWIQGTGPASKPNVPIKNSIRNIAYALLSGADGWMFDGEDALGQINNMSLDNQRNLKLAINKDPLFLEVAEQIANEMNRWANGFFGNNIVDDWHKQLDFTTKIFRCRGLHLDDRHFRIKNGKALSASIVDVVIYVVNNYETLIKNGISIVLYLPKIQTAEEAALWNKMITALEEHLGIDVGTIKAYVLVEQLEASYQLMEIRDALGVHFVGFNTGRWDYINSVADAMAWDKDFINPNIEDINMTYGYMRIYEDRVRRAVNTPDKNGNFALWQGGMEPNIPVGSPEGLKVSMEKAKAGAVREQKEGASGKWVAHWKMVHIIRSVWEEVGEANQLGRKFPELTHTDEDAENLTLLEGSVRSIRGARNLLSVALQYGNAFGNGFQAVALKPADFFGNDNVLYLMEDAATGEIRLSILWEWLHKGGKLTEDDAGTGLKQGDVFTLKIFNKLVEEEYDKLLKADNKDVYDDSKKTTLPIAKLIAETYVLDSAKSPWYIDYLNINLNNYDLDIARERINLYLREFKSSGFRITENLDFLPDSNVSNIRGNEMNLFEQDVQEMKEYMSQPRFGNTRRLYSARQIVEQQGAIENDYTVARKAAQEFYELLRSKFNSKKSISTFGPYSPGHAVAMKRMGIESIYLGGWATSAKGSINEDPGPDLASYPLSQVPDEAASLVRALLTADKNQQFLRSRMTEDQRKATPVADYRPFIIADADTGHGGEAHVRNVIRRFVEVGVPGYHIEDQKPGVKKCGHQAGKVLVAQSEQNIRLNAARMQLDIMKVPGIIVARTDAEAATYLEVRSDERDEPYILGATQVNLPSYKISYLSILKKLHDSGVEDINGHLLYNISDEAYEHANEWLNKDGIMGFIEEEVKKYNESDDGSIENLLTTITSEYLEKWQDQASIKTYGEAVKEAMEFQIDEGNSFPMSTNAWSLFSSEHSLAESSAKAKEMGIDIIWDCEICRTPEGYYQIKGGIEYAIAKSLAAAPYADLIWMETKTANLPYAKQFADAIHAKYPDQMLAYNLSPSFNWDTTGMTEDEMRRFPEELGKLGYVFNFITYGGHQIDGLAAEEFTTALQQEGMLALAKLQRKFRLLNSPYKTPQSYVGGPRLDGALMAATGRIATTMAMGKDSTQFQHLIQTELPPKLLEQWLDLWAQHYGISNKISVSLLPHTAGSELLNLKVNDESGNTISGIVFTYFQDRKGKSIISIRDQNIFDLHRRQKRLMTLLLLFLILRYKSDSIHYVTPTEDNIFQSKGMMKLGFYKDVNTEIEEILVVKVNTDYAEKFLNADQELLKKLIAKEV